VGRQAETDTSALQERLDAVSRDVDALRRQEEALANKMRSTRERLKEVENLLKEPQNLEGQIRSKRLRYDSQLEALNDMQSLEDLERNVVSKAAALKKKIVGFSQAYASAVDVQPQVWGLPGWCFVG
jgi:predicted  nucleic acid-binding Zn-ribbon protein